MTRIPFVSSNSMYRHAWSRRGSVIEANSVQRPPFLRSSSYPEFNEVVLELSWPPESLANLKVNVPLCKFLFYRYSSVPNCGIVPNKNIVLHITKNS